MDKILYKGVSVGDKSFSVVGRLIKEGSKTYIFACSYHFKSEVMPETVCKYLGFEDKNNVEVFEDDILRTDNGHTVLCKAKNGIARFALMHLCESGTIIGNIHTNPELEGECSA